MTETLIYEVRRGHSKGEIDAALELRHDVFCEEQGVPKHEELDGRDHEALHLVAVGEGELLGTCRLLFVGPTVQFSRLAVRAPAGSCSTPRPTPSSCMRAPGTSRADGRSWRPTSSTWRWRDSFKCFAGKH